MTIADGLMILAVILGPIVAVQLTRFLDDRKGARARKVDIFKTLMATREYLVSWEHVEALNRIDLEFNGKRAKEKAVVNAWRKYHDWLGRRGEVPDEQWLDKRRDLLVELLHQMAKMLKYDFDETHIKNSSYSPLAHATAENEQIVIRQWLAGVIRSESAIPMKVTNLKDIVAEDGGEE